MFVDNPFTKIKIIVKKVKKFKSFTFLFTKLTVKVHNYYLITLSGTLKFIYSVKATKF